MLKYYLAAVASFFFIYLFIPCISGSEEALDEITAASTKTESENGTRWREISLDEYTGADSLMSVPANVTAYLVANNCKDQDSIVKLLGNARARAIAAGYKPPSLLLACCIARWETGATWDINARGKAGERGLLQIHPIHDSSMRKTDLDPQNIEDQLLYGMMLYSWQGLKPWAVKTRALRDYREWAE